MQGSERHAAADLRQVLHRGDAAYPGGRVKGVIRDLGEDVGALAEKHERPTRAGSPGVLTLRRRVKRWQRLGRLQMSKCQDRPRIALLRMLDKFRGEGGA